MTPIVNGDVKELKAVIMDRDEAFGRKMKAELNHCMKKICFRMEVSVENDKWELLKTEEAYDIYFISLDEPGLENLELAKKLRKKNVDSEIVFVSMGEESMRLSLCVKPIAYVRKRELGRDLEEAMHAFFEMWRLKHRKVIILDSKKPCLIEPGEIKFCQSVEHYVKFYRRNGDYIIIRNSMNEVAKALSFYSFVRVNVRNMVNMNYIASLENNKVTLEDGHEFAVSKTYRNAADSTIWKHFNEISYQK